MTELEHITAKIEADIVSREHGDPVMQELCLNILKQLKSSPLKQETSGRKLSGNPDKEEQIRIEFIQNAQNIGGALAIQNFDKETEYPGDLFFQNLIRNGLASIGREIAAGYASKLYPELRHLRDNGEKPPRDKTSSPTQRRFYGFILKNYSDRFELAPVMEMETCKPRSIYYDDKKKRYIEEFVYDSPERADAMHGAWERFIAKKTVRTPVIYRFSISYDATNQCTISSVSHAFFSAKGKKIVNPDGSCSEIRIFQSLWEADRVRATMQKALNTQAKTQTVETAPIIDKEMPVSHESLPITNHIPKKTQETQPENSFLQQNNKGRTVS